MTLLKYAIPELAHRLKVIINRMLNKGIFHGKLKIVHKKAKFIKGNKQQIRNYIPLVLQSNISNTFERVILPPYTLPRHTRVIFIYLLIAKITKNKQCQS